MILSFRYKIKEYSTAKNLLQILPFISIQTQRTFICPYNVLVCVDTGNLSMQISPSLMKLLRAAVWGPFRNHPHVLILRREEGGVLPNVINHPSPRWSYSADTTGLWEFWVPTKWQTYFVFK